MENIEVLKEKARYWDAVRASDNSIDLNSFSKILNKNGINIGRNRLAKTLRKK